MYDFACCISKSCISKSFPNVYNVNLSHPDNQNKGELQQARREKKKTWFSFETASSVSQRLNFSSSLPSGLLVFFLIANLLWVRQQQPRINGGQYSVEHSVQFYKMLRSLTAVTYFMIRWAELCTTSRMKKSNNIKPSETKWWHKAELKITINIHCQLKVKSKN